MVFKIAIPGVQGGEPSSCLQDPEVKSYLDQITPKSQEYLDLANFNTYIHNELKQEEVSLVQLSSVEDEEPICCMAMIASCLACQAGMSIEDYCAIYPET